MAFLAFKMIVTFRIGLQVDLQLTKDGQQAACQRPADISLIAPDDEHKRTNLTFTCDAANFGVYRYQLPDLADIGRWMYIVHPGDPYDSLAVTVTGKARTADDADPIRTRCWVSTGSQQLNTGVSLDMLKLKISFYATIISYIFVLFTLGKSQAGRHGGGNAGQQAGHRGHGGGPGGATARAGAGPPPTTRNSAHGQRGR